MRSAGRTSPITPVEARKTCVAGQPASAPAALAVAFTVATPARPVKTLALPALTTSARPRPLCSTERHQSIGAPGQRLRVKTPATVVPRGKTIIMRSRRPL